MEKSPFLLLIIVICFVSCVQEVEKKNYINTLDRDKVTKAFGLNYNNDFYLCNSPDQLKTVLDSLWFGDTKKCAFKIKHLAKYIGEKPDSLHYLHKYISRHDGRTYFFCEEKKGNIEKYLHLFDPANFKQITLNQEEERNAILDSLEKIENALVLFPNGDAYAKKDSLKPSIQPVMYIETNASLSSGK